MKELLIIVFISLFLISCTEKTPLSKDHKVYAGKWVASDGTWIHLFNDGGGNFQLSNSSVTGANSIITDSTIIIEVLGIGNTFHIDKKPYENQGALEIVLDGNIYVKED